MEKVIETSPVTRTYLFQQLVHLLQDLKDVILLRTKADPVLPGRSLPDYEES